MILTCRAVECMLHLMHRHQNLWGGGLRIKIGRLWYTTISVVNPTVIEIIFALSIVLFFSNLKSINGNGVFFSIAINRNRETINATENMIICIKSFEPAFSKN